MKMKTPMKKSKYLLSLLTFMLIPGLLQAQTNSGSLYEQYQLEIVLGLAIVVGIVALITLITVWIALKAVLKVTQPETEQKLIAAKPGEEGVGFWRKLWNRMNDSVPVSQEADVMTSHEYDGIRELDNRLPPWWLYGFYASIIFGVIYLLNFHVFKTGDLQTAEYEQEMASAKAQVESYLATQENLVDESNVTFTAEAADLAAGKEIFMSQCAACHGNQGQGTVGPNLTDSYWIHGGSIQDIFRTVKYGVPQKGMISWQSQLSPKAMQQVSSYIYTLEGTNPPNPKAPQGEPYEREDNAAGESPSSEAGDVLEAGM